MIYMVTTWVKVIIINVENPLPDTYNGLKLTVDNTIYNLNHNYGNQYTLPLNSSPFVNGQTHQIRIEPVL